MSYLALDYGGTFIKYGIVNEEAEILQKGEVPAPLTSRDDFVAVTAKIYEQFKGTVKGVAISLPGIINSITGYARTAGAYSKILQGTDIIELLKPVIDVPISVENDGKAAIQAEMWKGSLEGVANGAACIVGSGLGGGILMDGKLRKGECFASGEISILMSEAGEYGLAGFAANKASMTAFLKRVAAAKGMDPHDFEISGSAGTGEDGKKKISGLDVFGWIEEGDPVTCEVYDAWLKDLVMVLFNLKITLDPAKIVVGGGVSRNPRFIKDLTAEFDKAQTLVKAAGFPVTTIEACRFSSDANLIGAVYNWIFNYGD